jgi:hypothetical protein
MSYPSPSIACPSAVPLRIGMVRVALQIGHDLLMEMVNRGLLKAEFHDRAYAHDFWRGHWEFDRASVESIHLVLQRERLASGHPVIPRARILELLESTGSVSER